MITLENVSIANEHYNSFVINWEVQSTAEDLSNYVVDFYRSEYPGAISEYVPVVSGVQSDIGIYYDRNLEQMDQSHNRRIHYYLVARSTISDTTSNFGPFWIQTSMDYVAKEIIRRKDIVLNNPRYNAQTFYLLKRKTWSMNCTRCYDITSQRSQDANCPVCLGTGKVGGYYPELPIKGTRSDNPNQHQLNLFGKWEDSNVYFNFAGSPAVIPGDYIADSLNNRYVVEGPVKHTEKGMYRIEQMVRAKSVSKSDPIYSVPIDMTEPVVNFSGSQLLFSGVETGEVTFTNLTQGLVLGYKWYFPDYSISFDENPTYTYSGAESYDVKLTAVTPWGDISETKEDYITIV